MMQNSKTITGYVKIFRSITEKGWYRKPDFFHLFTHLLLNAAHSPYHTWFNGKTMRLSPGQLITGRKKLSQETGINESKIERVLKVFEIEQQIEQQKTSTSRLITITTWDEYQKSEQPFKQRVNNQRTTSEQRVNTNQEDKEGKKDQEDKNIRKPVKDLLKKGGRGKRTKECPAPEQIEYPFSPGFIPVWQRWKEYKSTQHRFSYKGVVSEKAALESLQLLAQGQEQLATKIIEQSISNGWKGFFELKNGNKHTSSVAMKSSKSAGAVALVESLKEDLAMGLSAKL